MSYQQRNIFELNRKQLLKQTVLKTRSVDYSFQTNDMVTLLHLPRYNPGQLCSLDNEQRKISDAHCMVEYEYVDLVVVLTQV